MAHKINEILDLKTKLLLHLSSFSTIFFLAVYNKQVCSFLDSIYIPEFVVNLLIVFVFQVILREILFYFYKPSGKHSLARSGYLASVITWCSAGVFAIALHSYRYPYFPFHSHIKLFSSYWVLGAGILCQWEYVLMERAERKHNVNYTSNFNYIEKITKRIREGYLLFTIVPVIVMLMVIYRYAFEQSIEMSVAFETAYIGIFCVMIALIVAYRYTQRLESDTKSIVEAIQQVEQGQLSVKLDVTRLDELGEMSSGINLMAQGLQQRERIKEAFGRFVSPQVAEEFIEKYVKQGNELKLGGERRNVVILMCDIRNFTPLAESMEPEKLTTILNCYFSEMVEIISKYNGLVDKFIGDAIMAVFGLTDYEKDPELNAVKAAIEMNKKGKLYSISKNDPGKKLNNGIGIHSGEVIAGYLGSSDRMEFTVIGTPVNVAARIESQTKPPNPPILFSKKIADKISHEIPTVSCLTVQLKGISSDMELFTIKE